MLEQLCYNPRGSEFQASKPIPNRTPTLVPALDEQEQQFSAVFCILREAIAEHAFPAASLAVTHADNLIVLKSFGEFVYEEDGAPSLSRSLRQGGDFDLSVGTLFDLASVTKAVATTTMAMILYECGLLELDAPVSGAIPEFLTDDA